MIQIMVIFWGFKPGNTGLLWNCRGIYCLHLQHNGPWLNWIWKEGREGRGREGRNVCMYQFHKKVEQILTNGLSSPHIHSCICPSAGPANGHSWSSKLHLPQFKPSHPCQNYPILPHNSQTPSHLTLASTIKTFSHPKDGSSKFLQTACTNLHHITGKTPQTHYVNNNP